ncbi:MAG: response regulator transcription factor [Acholeplasmataceae bacterium]|nr:response regulator transcription factor [Acholeplasmataceae bacterium]
MIRIAIVEDDKNYIDKLKDLLSRYESESNKKLMITVFKDGEDIAIEYKPIYDIILMDIEMCFMDGMTAAAKIRESDSEVILIFITNMPQYVMEGYKVDALDYVLKPINYFELSQRIDRAVKRMSRRTKKFITIQVGNGVQKIEISDIYFIEIQNHDAIYHTTEGTYTTREPLKSLEKSLKGECFFRCHRSYIVNLAHVDSVNGNETYIANHIIPLSRARRKEFIDSINNYFNEVGK